MTLADQISWLEKFIKERGPAEPELDAILKTVKFLAGYEMEVRAAVPLWKAAKESPAAAQVLAQFPDSKTVGQE